MHTSLLIPYFSFSWTFPSHRSYVLINYQKFFKKKSLRGRVSCHGHGCGHFSVTICAVTVTAVLCKLRFAQRCLIGRPRGAHTAMLWLSDSLADRVTSSRLVSDGHGHGHGVFILATSSKEKWTTNPTPAREAKNTQPCHSQRSSPLPQCFSKLFETAHQSHGYDHTFGHGQGCAGLIIWTTISGMIGINYSNDT